MNVVTRGLLALVGAANAAFGAWGLVRPGAVADLLGLQATGIQGIGEVRAVYGGLVLMLGLLMVASAWRDAGAATLRAMSVLFVGLVLGRAASVMLDGPAAATLGAGAFEAFSAALLVAAAGQVERA